MVYIPGFRTAAQVEENAKALELGPLNQEQVSQIRQIVSQIGEAPEKALELKMINFLSSMCIHPRERKD